MKEIDFNIELTVSDLYGFSMRHTYKNISGIVGLLISVGALLICLLQYHTLDKTTIMALIVIGLLFTVVQPIMLYFKSKAQIRKNKSINAPLHYHIFEQGIEVSQGSQTACVNWYDIRKKVQTAKALYLYMSPVRAFIFPMKQCADQYEAIGALIKERMEAYKDFVPEEETEESIEEGKTEE